MLLWKTKGCGYNRWSSLMVFRLLFNHSHQRLLVIPSLTHWEILTSLFLLYPVWQYPVLKTVKENLKKRSQQIRNKMVAKPPLLVVTCKQKPICSQINNWGEKKGKRKGATPVPHKSEITDRSNKWQWSWLQFNVLTRTLDRKTLGVLWAIESTQTLFQTK